MEKSIILYLFSSAMQVCQRKNDVFLQAAIMVLMASVKVSQQYFCSLFKAFLQTFLIFCCMLFWAIQLDFYCMWFPSLNRKNGWMGSVNHY
jgi:hypothetical protein